MRLTNARGCRAAVRGAARCAALFTFVATAVSAQPKLATWTATELWHVDGTEGGEPFGDLRDYVVQKDGTLWVLDFKDQSIRRFSANGKPLPNVARMGSGPGEIKNANGMLLTPDGSKVGWFRDPDGNLLSVVQFSAKD